VIAVVIVTFSAEVAMLDACVASARSGGGVSHVIVVDNGGRAVSDVIADTNIDVVRPSRNLGFGGGANAGFRRAFELGATAIALLNDDIEAEPGWVAPLVAVLDGDAAIGAVQPKLLLAGSEPARVNSLGVIVGRDGAGGDLGYGEVDGPQFAANRRIESFTGGAVLFRSEFLQATGGFDESYFLYYEDLDLARRGAALGWTYHCVPASVVWHRVSASTSQLGDKARYLQERNRLRFAFRFESAATIRRALWLSLRRVRWSPRGAHTRALFAGLVAAPKALLARLRAS
jgi:N-acetylglucosaminyl-diphospho-decaprenol L-rhamnosyltransferase